MTVENVIAKKVLQQVSNKVTFPREPKVTTACKALINKILLPVKARIRIPGIRNDAWFTFTPTDKAGSSREHSVSLSWPQ